MKLSNWICYGHERTHKPEINKPKKEFGTKADMYCLWQARDAPTTLLQRDTTPGITHTRIMVLRQISTVTETPKMLQPY